MLLSRFRGNPILRPSPSRPWESCAVFNCGVVHDGVRIHMLYRAIGEYDHYVSRLGYAVSRDGVSFTRLDKPVIEPDRSYDRWGCEDPRITSIDGTYYITYVALSKPPKMGGGPPRTALATTQDFKTYRKHGIITPEGSDSRDTVLFPRKINKQYVMLHRPYNWVRWNIWKNSGRLYTRFGEREVELKLEDEPRFPDRPSIWIAYSKDLKNWHGYKPIMEPRESWESWKIGAGPPPIETEEGWLLIYHGVDRDKTYRVGAALLDPDNPERIIARTRTPLLEPEAPYEKNGDVPNVVFPTGAITIEDKLYIYYGSADKTCSLATTSLKTLIKQIKSQR